MSGIIMENIDQQIAIAWIDLTFSAKRFYLGSQKVILRNLTGNVMFGSLNGLMGPSGAGKSTLLNCLNGKYKSGLDPQTKICLNSNQPIRSSFVGQNVKEHLIMSLTAKQTLIYSSKLKNSGDNQIISHKKTAYNLLSELMLTNCENTRVCDMSGGEQKRLSVAIELSQFNKPNVLCIDEPTTGLDSNSAEILMFCLKRLSESHGIAIITSIHQPNNDILLMFDQIYMLSIRGICIYAGPPKDLRSHFSECNLNCNSDENPIEVLMTFASNIDEKENINKLSEKSLEYMTGLEEKCQFETKIFKNGIPFESKRFIWKDICHLFMRTVHTEYVSQWKYLLAMLFVYPLIPIIFRPLFNADIFVPSGCLTLNNSIDSCDEEFEENPLLDQTYKYLFIVILTPILLKFLTTTVAFHYDLKLFLTEHRNKWYSTTVFFIVKNIIDLMPTLLQSALVVFTISYFTGILVHSNKLLDFLLIFTNGLIVAQSLAYLISIVCINFNEMLSLQVAILLFTNNLHLSNSMILLKDTPPSYQDSSFTSYIKYVHNSVIILIYGLNTCSASELSKPLDKFNLTNQTLVDYRNSIIIYALVSRVCVLFALFIRTTTFDMCMVNSFFNRISFRFIRKSQPIDRSMNLKLNGNDFSNADNNNQQSNQISVAWIDLSFSVKAILQKQKLILRSLNGYFEFGTLNALMGPSGAGKTTLLNCLSGKNLSGLSDHARFYKNKLRTIKTSFITQDVGCHLISGLTAKESLIFASKLKNSRISNCNHELMAQNILNDLLITDISDTRTENCSGGQQKRIVLGMELMSKVMPNLICIDEPTSGLDSYSAQTVIKCLKYISKVHEITIITSIHQPSSDVLSIFDTLYILAKSGICIYSGQPGNLQTYLNITGIPLNENQYPIEVLIKFASNQSQNICKKLSEKVLEQKSDLILRCKTETQFLMNGIKTIRKRFYFKDLFILLNRFKLTTIRHNWKYLLLEALIYTIIPLTLFSSSQSESSQQNGCISFDEDFSKCIKTEEELTNQNILTRDIVNCFFVLFTANFFQLISSTIKCNNEMKTCFVEHRNGWYSIGSFYWSKTIVDSLQTLVFLMIYLLLFNMFSNVQTFLMVYFLLVISSFTIQGVSHLMAIMFGKSLRTAFVIAIGFFVFQMIFSNWLVFTKELHYSVQLLTNFSIMKLSFEAMLVYIYGFDRCGDREFSGVLYLLDIDDNTFYSNIFTLIIQSIVFRILTLIAFTVKANGLSKSRPQNSEDVSKESEVLF